MRAIQPQRKSQPDGQHTHGGIGQKRQQLLEQPRLLNEAVAPHGDVCDLCRGRWTRD
jgi:hypothetical protein